MTTYCLLQVNILKDNNDTLQCSHFKKLTSMTCSHRLYG